MKNFITFKDALFLCDTEKLKREIGYTYDIDCREKCISNTMDFIHAIENVEPNPNHKFAILMGSNRHEISNMYFESGLVYKNEINLEIIDKKNYEELLGKYPKEVESSLLSCLIKETNYAYEYSSTKDILGFYVPVDLFMHYNLEKFVASVLYELTFFGFTIEDCEEGKEEVFERIDDFEESFGPFTPVEEEKESIEEGINSYYKWLMKRGYLERFTRNIEDLEKITVHNLIVKSLLDEKDA